MIRQGMDRFFRWCDRHLLEVFGLCAVGLFLLIVLWPLIIYTVPAGHAGVVWYRFLGGTDTDPDDILAEGTHVIWPWDKLYIYDVRLRRLKESLTGLSVDGLHISLDLSSRYAIDRRYVGYLHKAIGPDYENVLMRPQLRTLALTYISEKEASDLYSTRRDTVQGIIAAMFQVALTDISTNAPFDGSYILLEDLLIEEITLPAFIRQAIEEKEKLRHVSDAYEYRLELEEKERRRKQIEAEGIRAFQEVVAPGITDSYLRWRGIEATLRLSESNNTKVVIIGGADGLPLILNADGGPGSNLGVGGSPAAAGPMSLPPGTPLGNMPLEPLDAPGASANSARVPPAMPSMPPATVESTPEAAPPVQ